MPPKKEKGPKQLAASSQLTAFLNVYKAACKRYACPADKALLAEVEDLLLDCKALEKVSLRGPEKTSGALRAVLDALAGYPSIKNLAMWGTSIGDEGLLALSQLLRASVDRFWRGSKLRLLELVNDGVGLPADKWPERYLAMVNGTSPAGVTHGPGFPLPSLVFGEAEAVTLNTIALQQSPHPEAVGGAPAPPSPLDLASLERQLSSLMASTSFTTTATYLALRDAADARAAHSQAPGSGLPPALGATGAGGGLYVGAPATGRMTATGGLAADQPPLAFSPPILKEFSLALGAQGLLLQILVLDHNHLGDAGMRVLVPGLRRCKPLQQLSLAHCGIGPLGARAFGDSLAPDPNVLLAEVQPRYKLLNLTGNPMGAEGLAAVAAGVRHCPVLKALHVAAIQLGSSHPDMDALQDLADSLAANPSIEQVDLDANHIGDVGATVLLPFLQSQKHIKKMRLTPRLSRPVMQAVQEAVRANLPKPKKRAKKVVKK